MRQRDINRKAFNAAHYNIVAGRLRNALEPYMQPNTQEIANGSLLHARVALVDLCLSFAYRFQADNEDFDPIRFLKACSPNVDEFPLDELWDIDNYQHSLKVELKD